MNVYKGGADFFIRGRSFSHRSSICLFILIVHLLCICYYSTAFANANYFSAFWIQAKKKLAGLYRSQSDGDNIFTG